jgi:SNF2 family DNA or RNA helicase
MFDKLRILTQSGEAVTSVNEGVLQSKLLQIACGFLYTDKGTIYSMPMVGRLKALEEVISETDRKVIVFAPFIAALTNVASHLRDKGHTVAVVHGATTRAARDKIFREFQNEAEPRIVVAHPKCMAHGLTLTAANTIIWLTAPFSHEDYTQANARIVRPSQTSNTLIVHLGGTPVEKLTYARLKSRTRMEGILLQLFHEQELVY